MSPTPFSSDGEENSGRLVRRLYREHLRHHLGTIALAILCMALVAASTAAMAKMMEPIIDTIFTERRGDMLVPVAAAVLAIFLVKGFGTYAQSVLMNNVGRKIIAELQDRMFATLMRADLASFHETASGKLVSRFTFDVQQLYGAVANAITGMGKDALTVAALVILMFSLDWRLALAAFFIFPAAMLPIIRLGKRMRKVSRSTQTEFGQLTAQLGQTFQGIRHVKAYNAEEREAARARGLIWQVARLNQKAARIRSASHPIMEALGGIAIVIIILYGGSQVIEGERTAGSFFSFITALLLAYEPMKKLAQLNSTLQQGMAAAQRVFATIDEEPRIRDRDGAETLPRVEGRIELKSVEFAYGDAPALHDVSLNVPAGKTVALVGPSGAGKSTILNLIPRFYDVTAGAVMIDGRDIRDVTMKSLRDEIALVSQEVTLFDDTVLANIAYGRPDATQEEVEEAARNAAAHDFILSLPHGYDTMVGEQGVKLSGGQRQRLSIARAMLKDAPILLLDEATSALDTESERLVQEALQRLMKGRTTLVIAHRLSTVRDADIIYGMEDGRVVESGSHAELLTRGGLYAKLWSLQTRHPEAESDFIDEEALRVTGGGRG
ncbi:lipid A export permease/ATP-binding protein MsbA [Inquilinus sp. CAU 1745]|uniref:lipid A export permease/ATP-binding protein MsbA n=1 Tax=Inquilinus sp. CAU 1745 TaxID=3140369 RepID=UPI00325B771E